MYLDSLFLLVLAAVAIATAWPTIKSAFSLILLGVDLAEAQCPNCRGTGYDKGIPCVCSER